MNSAGDRGNLQPKHRLIVDSHVHMWKAATPKRPWVPGARPQLPEPFTIERIVPMMDEAGVDRVIIVPPARRFAIWKEQLGVLGIRLNIRGDDASLLAMAALDWFWSAAETAGIPVLFLTIGQTHPFARIPERLWLAENERVHGRSHQIQYEIFE